jgi:hypothetical protein
MERTMAHVEVNANPRKDDWTIITGYLACALLFLVIYYVGNSPGTNMGDVMSMSVFP